MEKCLEAYLEKVEKCLKPLPGSERVDIVKEIKSEMLELQAEGKTAEEVVARLGLPGVQYIGITGVSSPVLVFVLSAVFGVALFLAGYGCWRLLVLYIKGMGRVKTGLAL